MALQQHATPIHLQPSHFDSVRIQELGSITNNVPLTPVNEVTIPVEPGDDDSFLKFIVQFRAPVQAQAPNSNLQRNQRSSRRSNSNRFANHCNQQEEEAPVDTSKGYKLTTNLTKTATGSTSKRCVPTNQHTVIPFSFLKIRLKTSAARQNCAHPRRVSRMQSGYAASQWRCSLPSSAYVQQRQ
jgi:hypothetical protein